MSAAAQPPATNSSQGTFACLDGRLCRLLSHLAQSQGTSTWRNGSVAPPVDAIGGSQPVPTTTTFFSWAGFLPYGREGVVPVAVAGLNLAILTVDEQLGPLVPADLPGRVHGIGLGPGVPADAISAASANIPSAIRAWNNMMRFCCHDFAPQASGLPVYRLIGRPRSVRLVVGRVGHPLRASHLSVRSMGRNRLATPSPY